MPTGSNSNDVVKPTEMATTHHSNYISHCPPLCSKHMPWSPPASILCIPLTSKMPSYAEFTKHYHLRISSNVSSVIDPFPLPTLLVNSNLLCLFQYTYILLNSLRAGNHMLFTFIVPTLHYTHNNSHTPLHTYLLCTLFIELTESRPPNHTSADTTTNILECVLEIQ